jgi:hypothetical protein
MKNITKVIALTTALAVGFTSYIPAAEAMPKLTRPATTKGVAGVDNSSVSKAVGKVKKAKVKKPKKAKIKKPKKMKKPKKLKAPKAIGAAKHAVRSPGAASSASKNF